MKQSIVCKNNTNTEFHFTESINYQAKKCIHGLFCYICCHIDYVGEIGTSLYQIFQNHISSIRSGVKESVPIHFNSMGQAF